MSSIQESETKSNQTETESEPVHGKLDQEEVRISQLGHNMASLMLVWDEVSRLNYMKNRHLERVSSAALSAGLRRKNIGVPISEHSISDLVSTECRNKSEEKLFTEQFPTNVTPLMNEDNYWGCFYTFPELYADEYSPVVHIRNIEDVPELVGGDLTRDMVTACLSYLKRTPILGDYVYIKLNLSSKHLMNIDVLQHYKYLVYLDLSSNLLTELTVLSYLLYLQYLSVAFNRLGTVLDYKTPQWFLTEVHYKYNSVKKIRDLTKFWSITILDLSHNNIKCISGLESLMYLRRLDLSFNHIQRLENLNHLRLIWLDVSYNNISSYEFGPNAGLWTLLHLEYLNLNENNLTSMKMLSYCTRLRELHFRNNRLNVLLELAVYMCQMRRLIVLDLRANPICSMPLYKKVVINTFSMLLSLDAAELDPIEQRTVIMDMKPDITMLATRRLLQLLYIEQLSKARVSPYIPPADTIDVPIVILVGHEGVGKGCLARRLAAECSANIQLAYQHTTANHHFPGRFKEITRNKFDDMLLAGDFLTYMEKDGDSYGLSREEAFVKDGKVRIVSMDLLSALMLKLRGYRPYLILTTCLDRNSLTNRQQLRKTYRHISNQERISLEAPFERSTLQVLLSGRIIITGIINEILLSLPDEKEQSEFMMESECSLMLDSDARQAGKDYAKGINMLNLMNSSYSSLDDAQVKHAQEKTSMEERSLYSLFKESQGTDEYTSYNINGQNQGSYQERIKKLMDTRLSRQSKQTDRTDKHSSISQSHRLTVPDSSKSSKSVTFTSQDDHGEVEQPDVSGMMIEPQQEKNNNEPEMRTISTRMPVPGGYSRIGSRLSTEDSDLWIAFLTEAGFLQASNIDTTSTNGIHSKVIEDDTLMRQMDNPLLSDTPPMTIYDPYENVHHSSPGLFWDSVIMDDPDEAFRKVRGIIKNIVNSQKNLKPMFDIDFASLPDYPTVQRRLDKIRNQIAPQQLFY